LRQITLDAVSGIEELSQEDPINVFFEFGDSSVNLSVRMWIGSTEQSIYNGW
jgi:small-conductance mechanosensitive channel